jgi:hypothetical protein
MMRSRIRGDEDFAQAANAALGKNTDAMAKVVESLFGPQAAGQFSSLWAKHVTALFDYSRGLADHDSAVREHARETLTAFERDVVDFLAGAAQGRLSPDAAKSAILMHVDQLLRQADAYASGDYATAEKLLREAYAHTFGLGRSLAGALLPADQVAALDAPAWRLRSELGRMFAEHVVLMVDATRAGMADSPEFAAAADAMNGNTRDLTQAVDTLFGAAAASRFQSLWADHVDQIMAYTAGVQTHDAKRRDDALAKLHGFEGQFAAFLDNSTNARLASASLARSFALHDEMLLRHADAYAAKDYQKAHDIAYATYDETFDLAGQLADAFGSTIAARLPVGGAATGHGGMAHIVGRR